jgi:hypothetical protein
VVWVRSGRLPFVMDVKDDVDDMLLLCGSWYVSLSADGS